jgi:hypothetical protein
VIVARGRGSEMILDSGEQTAIGLLFFALLWCSLSLRLFVKGIDAEQGYRPCGVDAGRAKIYILGMREGARFY